jgi:NADPH:quinone reductase-like Zn-dependent oxidoreductase
MNFRDVLIVLKPELFPDHKGDIGFECSGVVAEVGPGCGGRLRVGDEVIAMCGGGCYGSHAVAQEDCVVAKPAGLTYEKAAALPVAGVTAAWCLERIAQVGPG